MGFFTRKRLDGLFCLGLFFLLLSVWPWQVRSSSHGRKWWLALRAPSSCSPSTCSLCKSSGTSDPGQPSRGERRSREKMVVCPQACLPPHGPPRLPLSLQRLWQRQVPMSPALPSAATHYRLPQLHKCSLSDALQPVWREKPITTGPKHSFAHLNAILH